ncbi:Ubiquitin domain-containing protein 2 [Chlorella vulgaris]
MGAVCCKPEDDELGDPTFGSTRVKSWKRSKWRTDEAITASQLQRMRDEFWDTEPHYGGNRVIWDTLKAACEADLETARTILDSAGVIVAAPDMTICYDERGCKYELPRYVITPPSNLTRELSEGSSKGGSARRTVSGDGRGGGGQLELPAVAAGTGSPPIMPSPSSDSLPDDAAARAPLSQVAVR